MDTETRAIHTFAEGELFDGRYRLVKRAGSGGFADVWRAEDTLRNNRVVALKIYTRLDEDGIKQMSLEYDETEYLRHPNLLTGNHFAAVGNIPYMEMQFCDGSSLAKRVGEMDNSEIRHVMRDILSGLVYLHSQGIVHQDIKPENILHDSTHGIYMLADFGISGKSRTRLSKSVHRDDNSLSMTLAYAPPEKFSSNPADWEPSTKGDIFSLGVTLFELATGNLPFAQPVNTGDRMLEKEGNVKIYFDSIDDPTLRHMAERCIRYRREDRPTAEELLAMLDSKTESQPESKPEPKPKPKPQSEGGHGKTVKLNDRPVTTEPKPAPKPHKNNWWIYAVMAAVAIALGALLMKTCSSPKPEPEPADTVADTIAADTATAKTANEPEQEACSKTESNESEEDRIFQVVQQDPVFPGGVSALYSFIRSETNYPQKAREKHINGTVYVTFVVEKDGSVSNVKAARDIGGGCGAEAVRVVKSMPQWTPGKHHGKIVRCAYTLPVKFDDPATTRSE